MNNLTVRSYPKIKPPARKEMVRYVEPSIYDLRAERKTTLCEWCNEREGVERHHMLVHDLTRFHDALTVKENLMIACDYCHRGICILDSYDMRKWFWSVQCQRYGVEHMQKWLNSLPDKLWISGRIDRAFLDGIGSDTSRKVVSVKQ